MRDIEKVWKEYREIKSVGRAFNTLSKDSREEMVECIQRLAYSKKKRYWHLRSLSMKKSPIDHSPTLTSGFVVRVKKRKEKSTLTIPKPPAFGAVDVYMPYWWGVLVAPKLDGWRCGSGKLIFSLGEVEQINSCVHIRPCIAYTAQEIRWSGISDVNSSLREFHKMMGGNYRWAAFLQLGTVRKVFIYSTKEAAIGVASRSMVNATLRQI